MLVVPLVSGKVFARCLLSDGLDVFSYYQVCGEQSRFYVQEELQTIYRCLAIL